MTSTARLGLVSVSLFLLLYPLTLGKPGLPTRLKADEAAYYGMAMSLAHDHDLMLGQEDVDRFFQEFPYSPVNNVILMSRDGWKTPLYGKPFVYSLLAAPFARVLGADGMLLWNELLLVAMIWMGALYLRRWNGEGLAALYSVGFFVLSVGFAYVFWLQPEVFNMAAVTACLFFGLPRTGDEDETGHLPRPRRDLLVAAISGGALALAVANKPMLAVLGLAPLVAYARERRWPLVAAWLGSAAAALLVLAGLSMAWTGGASSYLGGERGGFTLCGPGQMPVFPGQAPAAAAAPAAPAASASTSAPAPAASATTSGKTAADDRAGTSPAPTPGAAAPAPIATSAGPAGAAQAVKASPTGNSYRWLFRLPDTSPSELADNILYFLLGRHTGLLLYMPFALLSVLLFLLHARRSAERWVLLGGAAVVALFFLLLISWNWQGGGGFVGNRYYVNVYPAFLFLVTRVKPRAFVPVGYVLAGLFLAPLLLAPLGTPGPEPTLQMHVRERPFRWFPLELTLRNVPGYQRISLGDFRVVGRRDVFLPLGEQLLVQGATPVEIYLIAGGPLPKLAFSIGSKAPANHVDVRMGSFSTAVDLGAGESKVIEIPPQPPLRKWTIKDGTLWAWRVVVKPERGMPQIWEREFPPNTCPGWPWDPKQQDTFYTGATLTYVGDPAILQADVYHAHWQRVTLPPRVSAGERFVADVAIGNRSEVTWPNRGAARVRLAYHWLDESGATIVREGERTELPQPVEARTRVHVEQKVVAPAQPGRYTLVLEPLLETVSWFGDRDPGAVWRGTVEVGAPAAAPPEAH